MAGPLKNARHEKFAQELAKGETADAAFVLAGFKQNRGNATRLKANESVRARVDEIKALVAEQVVKKTAIDAAWVLKRAVELHDKALEKEAFPAAKGALELIGKHVDVRAFREQHEHTGPNGGPIEYRNLSDEEVAARISAHEAARAEQQRLTH